MTDVAREWSTPTQSVKTQVSAAALLTILERHNLSGRAVVALAGSSAGSSVFLIGDDLVLRVPHQHAASSEGLAVSRLVIPVARAVGVRTPRMLLVDDKCDLLPVPYAILERVTGEPSSHRHLPPVDMAQVWREVGHDLALLHTGVERKEPVNSLPSRDADDDPAPGSRLFSNVATLRLRTPPGYGECLMNWNR